MFGNGLYARRADRQEETRYIKVLGIFQIFVVVRWIDVIDGKTVGCRQIGAQRTMMTGDEHTTCARWRGLVVLVAHIDAI